MIAELVTRVIEFRDLSNDFILLFIKEPYKKNGIKKLMILLRGCNVVVISFWENEILHHLQLMPIDFDILGSEIVI